MAAFFVYDIFVQKRNRKVVAVAAKTNEIVASLFPEAVRGRLFEDSNKKGSSKKNKTSAGANENDDTMIKKFLSGGELDEQVYEEEDFMYKSRPIADLYPETTIMFADIAGFTAWSSTRDPAQVSSSKISPFAASPTTLSHCFGIGIHVVGNFLQGIRCHRQSKRNLQSGGKFAGGFVSYLSFV